MRYPEAIWRGDGVAGGTYTGAPYRIVLHTTETQGVPGYNEGRSAPHLTYSPRTRTWYQHTDLRYAARALRNEAGGVQTNRANAIQVEIICYSAKGIADRVGINGLWVGDLPDHAYTDLRRFVDWCSRFGVKPEWPRKQAFNSLQANTPGFRMTHSEWNRFNGVCGHQHVPENDHWDPGALNWARLIPAPPDEEEEMRVKEFVQGLKPGNIDELFDAGIIHGDRDYWKSLLAKPDDPAWFRFVTEIEVRTAINSARQASGGGPYKITLSGGAVPG